MKQFFTKRRILIIIVVVLLLAILALLLLPGGKRKDQSFQGGADTPYPFEWTERQDGSVLLSLCPQVPAGYAWRFEEEESETVRVSRAENAEEGVFCIQPLRSGDVLLRFALADESFPEDRCCELLLTAELRAEDEAFIASVSGTRLILTEESLRGGDSFGCPYRIRTEEGRLAVFLLDDSPEPDWQFFRRNGGDVLRLAGRTAEQGIVTLRFFGSGAGSSELLLYSAGKRLTLELTVSSDAEGALTVQAHEMAEHPEWEGLTDEALDAYVVAGDLRAPEGAEELRYARRSLGKQEAAVMSFRYLDVDWTVYAAAGPELETLAAGEFENERILSLAVGGQLMHACLREEEGTVAAWCRVGERSLLFEGSGETDLARLLETAGAVIAEIGK